MLNNLKCSTIVAVFVMFPFVSVCAQEGEAAQKDSIQLEDLKAPISPGFALLDVSPTSIESPTTPKMIAVNFVNAIRSGGGGIPKNFGMEFSPYWLFKHKNETIFKYMGLADKESSNIAAGVFRKMSISMTTYFNDSSKNLLPNTNYASFGLRTNLLTIWGTGRKDVLSLLESRSEVRRFVQTNYRNANPDTRRRLTDSLYEEKKAARSDVFRIKPLFVLDGAFAWSEAFRDNSYKNRHFNRSGFWLNATLSSSTNKRRQDNLFVIFYFRQMRDNVLIDTTGNVFSKRNSADIGLRAGYEKGRLSLSFEHISRKYADYKLLNSDRTIGILQVKVNSNFYLTGTFGKNFTARENLFTTLGLNWGIGKQSLALQ